MDRKRREFVLMAGAAIAGAAFAPVRASPAGAQTMYGLIGKMTAHAGKRDELVAILLEGVHDMPGCLSYIVAHDADDADAIWITEVWDGQDSHAASLKLPAVRAAIARAMPMIAGFDAGTTTHPVGGHGL
ncbi:putative quinol monooxygenase [Lysobacter sp. Root604]|uniref:putative quinol monooxygenase n=1 Tax=Lysobacter sp. Root604 TaxID=1736568 RepID=UPI001F222755|nr:putative quinol monooxygenase [Lysobacter sp. Root604]